MVYTGLDHYSLVEVSPANSLLLVQ